MNFKRKETEGVPKRDKDSVTHARLDIYVLHTRKEVSGSETNSIVVVMLD